MCHISHHRMRRFLLFSALLFSLSLVPNGCAIFHIPYSIFNISYGIWNIKYGVASAQEMPRESGDFRKPDLVELVKLDSTIKLDIRYATSNNFLGRQVYKEARAFLQRPAAEALMRASHKLREKGYGLLVFDGYRPWSVTKLFWDSTPQDKKRFVADPSQGSRHNRGCAVDLTLYNLRSGREVGMPSSYDEMTERAYPNYSGGTEEQRRMREMLREALESEGFTVYEFEWWHFDYKDWKQYPLLDISFNQIAQ
jgi:zinc D-Ala-D-Ala dipeptidase